MARYAAYITAVAAVVVVLGLAADVSTRTSTCMACHTKEASYARWMEKRVVTEKKGFAHELVSCAACHIEGAAAGTIMSGFRGLLHAITYLAPQMDPRRPVVTGLFATVHVPSENCQYCHYGAIRRKAVWLKDLRPELAKIGLAMDHRKHVLTREDTCARCHERYKEKTGPEADKGVNYSEVNHLGCTSCHTSASHAYRKDRVLAITDRQLPTLEEAAWKNLSGNPRWMVATPTEQSCRRCHNDKIHFKTRIFPADCKSGTNFDDCVKCHPLMTREYFEKYRKERNKLTTASAR
ncbi:MAG: hypothetical protein V2B18_18985 [Pseudomonadota bacterium]